MLDLVTPDNACALLTLGGLLLGVVGALTIRAANPLPASAPTACRYRPSTN